MEILFIRNVLTRAVTSRNRFALLLKSTRPITGGVAQAPLSLEKSALGSSDDKPSKTSAKVEKSEDIEHADTVPAKKEKTETQTSPMNHVQEMELPTKSSTDQMSAHLPLEPGKAASFPPPDGEKILSERVLRLANEIANLTILEVGDLNSALKKKLNLPDAPVFTQSFATAGSTSTAEEKAKSEKAKASQKMFFSLKLTKVDDSKKIPLIKEIRATVEGFNLVQAKKFVETLPATVKEDLSKKEAEELKAKLENLGALISAESKRSSMARGHQKIQSQQKKLKRQEELKKSKGSDQKAAAVKALTHKCIVCMALMPDPKTYKQHFQSKHPKAALPAELVDVQA